MKVEDNEKFKHIAKMLHFNLVKTMIETFKKLDLQDDQKSIVSLFAAAHFSSLVVLTSQECMGGKDKEKARSFFLNEFTNFLSIMSEP